MLKQLVVLSSLFAGTGLTGAAMYLQGNPLAPSNENRVNLDTSLYSAKTETKPSAEQAAPPAVDQQEAEELVMPEVIVTRARPAEGRRAPRAATASSEATPQAPATPVTSPTLDGNVPATEPRELHPCSKFRELGPMNVDDGVPSGVRGVRDLC